MARGVIKMAALIAIAKQARDYAQNNPESVNETIGKFEATVSSKLGPKYSAHVGKGGKALRDERAVRAFEGHYIGNRTDGDEPQEIEVA